MNILVPDKWLRVYLKTKATPVQIKQNLSLSGPSIERINKVGSDIVYDIEITGNRPDAMSIIGVAREAASILPRYGIKAELVGDPYNTKISSFAKASGDRQKLKLNVKTDSRLNPRWTSIIFDQVKIKPSPKWLMDYLKLVGVRPINNAIDITNYLMHAYGQPAHVFDYDAVTDHKMTLRAAKKGEKIVTLDGKSHTLPGGDIVIADGSGKLIDLCGIMGGENSSIKNETKRVILFLQTYDASQIRKTMMNLSHRTEAGSLFEKGLDPNLVYPVFLQGIKMMQDLTSGKTASAVVDIYPNPIKSGEIILAKNHLETYLGEKLKDSEIKSILTSLGFKLNISKSAIMVTPPSYRMDIKLDVDVIEEIARIYGYQRIRTLLPTGKIPMTEISAELDWEEMIKVRMRDWGYTEMLTYSMISEKQMDLFNIDKNKAYKISNPLTSDWVYMRPTLQPSILSAVKDNLNNAKDLRVFELSMIYKWQPENLPMECPILAVVWTGDKLLEAKGMAERLFEIFGIDFPDPDLNQKMDWKNPAKRMSLGDYGSIGLLREDLQNTLGLSTAVTVLDLDFQKMITNAKPHKTYSPIPKYPPSFEDLAFIISEKINLGALCSAIKKINKLIYKVELLDSFENTKTFHITYLDPAKNLTNEEITPIRGKIISLMQTKFAANLKG